MNDIKFEVNYLKEINSEENGQANKLLAYCNGNILINNQKISKFNGLKLVYSKFHNKMIVDIPQTKGSDNKYRNLYEIEPDIKEAISEAIISTYEARKTIANIS